MPSRKIIAVFDSQGAAQKAREELIELGLPREEVNIVDQGSQEVATRTANGDRGGFWAHIKEMFMPDEDRATLEESMRRGGYVLTATVSDAYADEAIRRLEATGAVDLEQRASEWREKGWQGAPEASQIESQTIPVAREQLRVGKREVDRGSVRVRSYIVEEPVHEEVRLREERVDVERRTVNAPTHPVPKGSPEDVFQERTVEVSETSEEAVVAKDAVVTEEVRVGKTAQERVEKIDDTVRRTEVDVEDARKPRGSRTKGTAPRPPRP